MKGKINIGGFLEILRGDGMEKQYCPFRHTVSRCGDWCPLFGEPREAANLSTANYHVDLCRKGLFFTEFTDERGRE